MGGSKLDFCISGHANRPVSQQRRTRRNFQQFSATQSVRCSCGPPLSQRPALPHPINIQHWGRHCICITIHFPLERPLSHRGCHLQGFKPMQPEQWQLNQRNQAHDQINLSHCPGKLFVRLASMRSESIVFEQQSVWIPRPSLLFTVTESLAGI